MHEILIVEDDPGMGIVFRATLSKLLERFPKAALTIVRTFSDARERLARHAAPDVIVLDLSLPDSTMEETLARYDELEERAPVVIVTGHQLERVRELLREPDQVEMIHKPIEEANILVGAIARAINRKQEESTQRIRRILDEMRDLIGPPHNAPAPISQ